MHRKAVRSTGHSLLCERAQFCPAVLLYKWHSLDQTSTTSSSSKQHLYGSMLKLQRPNYQLVQLHFHCQCYWGWCSVLSWAYFRDGDWGKKVKEKSVSVVPNCNICCWFSVCCTTLKRTIQWRLSGAFNEKKVSAKLQTVHTRLYHCQKKVNIWQNWIIKTRTYCRTKLERKIS